MKLLKKFLLIGLCSFCFYVSANAAININTRDTWDVIDNYLEYNPGKTVDDFIELIINTIPKPEFYADNYIMFIEYNDSSSFYLGWLSSVEFNLALNNTVMYIRDGNIKDSRKSNYSWAFEFNEDYSSLEYNQNSLSTHPAYFNFYSISDGSNPINAFIISSNLTEIKYTAPTWTKSDFTINNGLNYSYDTYIPLNSLNTNYAFVVQDFYNKSEIIYEEPTYSYLVEPSKNGKYKVNFKFENYDDENTNYRFSIVNKISNESFGEENSYKNVCFYDIEDLYNTIPFGNEYSIEVDNSTFLELKLYQYNQIDECYRYMKEEGNPIALVVRKNTFTPYKKGKNVNNYTITREEALETIIDNITDNDFIVSTTGKTSREIFELREKKNMDHGHDFLTVGSMGHTSSIALGMSLNTKKNVYCVDGDGSFIMHMGSSAITSLNAQDNFKYILINNGAHESVGGQPTVAFNIEVEKILEAVGYKDVYKASTCEEIKDCLEKMKDKKACLVIYTKEGSREDLGRPTKTPIENKEAIMVELQKN